MSRNERRKAIREQARDMSLPAIRSEAVRLAREARDVQALADAWRKAYTMEGNRRSRGGRSATDEVSP